MKAKGTDAPYLPIAFSGYPLDLDQESPRNQSQFDRDCPDRQVLVEQQKYSRQRRYLYYRDCDVVEMIADLCQPHHIVELFGVGLVDFVACPHDFVAVVGLVNFAAEPAVAVVGVVVVAVAAVAAAVAGDDMADY